MVGIVHDGESNAGRAQAHQNSKSQENPIACVETADHKKIRDQVQTKHEDRLPHHFRVAETTYVFRFEVFVYTLGDRREEFG